jgi:hypothetical protein
MVAKQEFTNMRDLIPNKYHRYIGAQCYMLDVDWLLYSFRKDSSIKFEAAISIKHRTMSYKPDNRAYAQLASDYDIPFFTIITYLDMPIPMLYVIPENYLANTFIHDNYTKVGQWMSLYEYSEFEHYVRGIKFNEEEIVKSETGMRIKDLSKEKTTYIVPEFWT